MKVLPIITITLTVSLFAGCQGSLNWKPLDGSRTNDAKLEEARKTCRIEIKLDGIERAEQERDKKLSQSSTNQAKMLAKEDFEQVKIQVYREIDTCMNKQGYKR